MAMSNVQRIQCGSPEIRTRTRRVGAYCRVSTLLESQQLSLETQMEGFKQKIAKTPGWKLVDIYADEGITGTSTKKRKEFRRMIQDAQDGKIDTIITKSISRFARNTLDCLHWQCGLSTTVPLPMDKNQTEEPTHVAELYETYLNRVDSGEYIPARPKSIFEKQLVAQKRVTKIGGKDDHKKN